MRLLKTIIWIFLIAGSLTAQGFDAKSLGLADNYSAISRGVQAMPWNPANLGLERGNTFELNLVSFNIALYNNSFSLSEYNRYFTKEGNGGKKYSEADKQAILDLIPDGGFRAISNAGVNAFGVAYNNFGFAVQIIEQGQAVAGVSKELLEIAFNGPTFTTDYYLHDNNPISGASFAAMKISAGYAYPLKTSKIKFLKFLRKHVSLISVGMNVNYYLGGAAAKIESSELKIKRFGANNDSVSYLTKIVGVSSATESGSPTGRGFGLDIGAVAKYKKRWFFSLSFSNLFASIKWTENVERFALEESGEIAILGDSNEDKEVSIDTTYTIDQFETKLPTVMRAGASYKLLDNLTLVAEWRQGFDDYINNTTTPRVGVGAEYYPLPWLPLRGGLAVGGTHGFQFGLGTGVKVGFFEFDMSYAVINSLWPTASEGIFAAFGFKLQF